MAGSEHAAESHEHFHNRFQSVKEYAKELDSSERDRWQLPERVLDSLQLVGATRVVDIGMGTGYFVLRIAERLPTGAVLGLDVEPAMVEHVREQARERGLANVTTQQAPLGSELSFPEPVDLVLCVNTYHHIPDRPSYFARYIPYLRPGGRVAIIDFKATAQMGPPQEYRVSAAKVAREMQAAGFRLQEQLDYLPHQFFLVFQRC